MLRRGASALRVHSVVKFPEDGCPARRPVLGQFCAGMGVVPGPGWASGVGRIRFVASPLTTPVVVWTPFPGNGPEVNVSGEKRMPRERKFPS